MKGILMRLLLALLLALAILPDRAQTLYVLEWHSALPLDPASLHIDVIGGALVSTITTQDATQGWIEATAPSACLTIAVSSRTTTGVAVRFARSWDAECQRVWLPLVAR